MAARIASPVRVVRTDDGLIAIYESRVVPEEIAVSALLLEGEFGISISGEFFVPERFLDLERRDICRIYLMGATQGMVETELLAVVELDLRSISRVLAYREILRDAGQ